MMRSKQRAALIVLILLLVLTGAGLVVTTEWGARTVAPSAATATSAQQSPVDLGQFRRAQALSQLAATPEEEDLARDVLRKADHEVDFAFASALYQASSKKIPSTPEIKDALDRITKSEQEDTEVTAEVTQLTKRVQGAPESQKEALDQQLDLAKSRQELIEDELADAHQDLERAGGDPQSSVQRMVDEYNASEQSSGGQLDLSIVGKQASAALPASYSFISRARAWYELHSIVGRLDQEERGATGAASSFSGLHDELEHQLEEAQAKQSKYSGRNIRGRFAVCLRNNQRGDFVLQVPDRPAKKTVRTGRSHSQPAGARGRLRPVERFCRHAPPRFDA
jgi:hypothetical protein